MTVDIANGLIKSGWQVHVVTTRDSGPLEGDLERRVAVHRLNRESRFDLRGLAAFRSLVRQHDPAIVHAHGWSSLQFATASLMTTPRVPKLLFHDHRPSGLAPVGWTYRALAWPLTRAHIAVDEALLRQAPPTFHSAIQAVVANGSPLDRYERKRAYDVRDPAGVVMVANLRPQKAHPVLFEALATLESRGVSMRVDLLGSVDDSVYLAECRTNLNMLGVGESVRIAGTCDSVGDRLADYDLGILTSMSESGPVALIEYLAAGLPFVVTDVGSVTRSLPSQLRRWVVEPGNPMALADRIEQALYRSEAERRSDAQVGLDFVHAELSIDRTVEGVERVYRQLLDK